MTCGMSVRSVWIAPVALGLSLMVGTAQAQTTPAPQTPPTQPPTQTPAQPAQPAQQQAPPEQPTFTGTTGVLLVQIKPDKVADYEAVLTKLKDALAKSEKPERKAMAKGWKVYKASEDAQGNVLYVHFIDPPAPGVDYTNPLRAIAEVFPTEAGDLYNKVKDGFVSTGRLNLTLVNDLGGAPAPAGQPE